PNRTSVGSRRSSRILPETTTRRCGCARTWYVAFSDCPIPLWAATTSGCDFRGQAVRGEAAPSGESAEPAFAESHARGGDERAPVQPGDPVQAAASGACRRACGDRFLPSRPERAAYPADGDRGVHEAEARRVSARDRRMTG